MEWEANAPEEMTSVANLPFLLGGVREATPKVHCPDTKRKIIRF